MTIKVAINGYGTIGKRVADAVKPQVDMEVAGVVKRTPTYEARMAVDKGFKFYAADAKYLPDFEAAGIPVAGTAMDLFAEADIVVDCTPKAQGYFEKYKELGVKAMFQGGEKHTMTDLSFNAFTNYDDNLGKDYTRVVSCNTTGLCRTLYPLKKFGIDNVIAVMIRRSADPGDSKRGPINAIEPVLKVPSHHGPDVKTVWEGLNIQTTAVKVPSTIMHMHSNIVTFKGQATSEDVIDAWCKTPRVKLFNAAEGIKSTAEIMEYARDAGQTRSDLFPIAVWEDGAHVVDGKLYYYQAIHQESDVIPDNVDAIRALCNAESDKWKSIEMTDRAMGIFQKEAVYGD